MKWVNRDACERYVVAAWVIDVLHKVRNLSYLYQVTFRWDNDDDDRYVLDQHD